MLVTFSQLPGSARIWIYQSPRQLTDAEIEIAVSETENFLQQWTAHQADLKAGVQILFKQFVVIGVDENYNDASGCSIDKKVNFIKQLGERLQIDFFNRMMLAYVRDKSIVTEQMHQITDKIKSGQLSSDTIVFNNLVSSKNQLDNSWQIPARESWLMQLV